MLSFFRIFHVCPEPRQTNLYRKYRRARILIVACFGERSFPFILRKYRGIPTWAGNQPGILPHSLRRWSGILKKSSVARFLVKIGKGRRSPFLFFLLATKEDFLNKSGLTEGTSVSKDLT
jgi:hypothetical protein